MQSKKDMNLLSVLRTPGHRRSVLVRRVVALLLLLAAAISAVTAAQEQPRTVVLARGERPGCSCFGAASADPVGATTLVRNGVLIAIAGFTVWGAAARPMSAAQAPDGRAAGAVP